MRRLILLWVFQWVSLAALLPTKAWSGPTPFPVSPSPIPGTTSFPAAPPLMPSWGSQPGDELWWNGFSLPSLDGWVNAIVEFEGKIVIGGRFTQVGGKPAAHIAAWNGSVWSPMGTGSNEDIHCLAVFGGELIAGGRFQRIDGVDALGVARWDGDRWSPLGAGLFTPNWQNPAVLALFVHEDRLYAAGEFTMAGDVPANHIAVWDGTTWMSVGNGVPFPGSAIAVWGDHLYVGGDFNTNDPGLGTGLAAWDGTNWLPIATSPLQGSPYGGVRAFASFGNQLVVAGYFEGVGGVVANGVATWNGVGWASMDVGAPGYVAALAVHEDELWLGGSEVYFESPAVRRWTGSEWLPTFAVTGQALCLHSTGRRLAAGGVIVARSEDGNLLATGVALWDSEWSGLESWSPDMHGLQSSQGMFSEVAALTVYRGNVLAGGWFAFCGDPPGYVRANGIASWDGMSWTAFPWYSSIDPPSTFYVEQDTLYTGGFFDNWFGPEHPVPVFRYDGQSWSPLDTLSLVVTDMTRYQGHLYIAGRRASLSHPAMQGVYRWDGEHWQAIGPVVGENFASVNAMISYEGLLVVGGEFSSIGSTPAKHLAAWDGSSWLPMEVAGLSSIPGITDLDVFQGELVAAAEEVFHFDGAQWAPLGSIRGVRRLATIGTNLFGGGWPYQPGWELSPVGVVRWDGRQWNRLGSGTSDPVGAFVEHGGSVYMGGRFTRAGNGTSFAIARWDGLTESSSPPSPSVISKVAPNPFRESLTLSLEIGAPGTVRVSVHDLHGRELVELANESLSQGDHPLVWNGRDHKGTRVASGIYFIHVQGPGDRSQAVKVVHTK
jgi:trimeric autotransporter adhesin